MNTVIKMNQIWTDGSSKCRIVSIIADKAYGQNIATKRLEPFVYLNSDNTPKEIAPCWQLIPGLQDPPIRFIIPGKISNEN